MKRIKIEDEIKLKIVEFLAFDLKDDVEIALYGRKSGDYLNISREWLKDRGEAARKIVNVCGDGVTEEELRYFMKFIHKIATFDGEYRFLSNFYEPSPVIWNGITFNSVEAAYQAAKSLDINDHVRFSTMSASFSKKAGRQLKLRPDWEEVKYSIMENLVRKKFQNPVMKDKLLATGHSYLEEGNRWNDTTWGVCRGEGKNWLGTILMDVREDIRNGNN